MHPGVALYQVARDDVQACGRISPESDENEIGGWRRQKEKKRRSGRGGEEGIEGSREDRETGETKGERRNRRERGKSFHRDRNEKGSGVVAALFFHLQTPNGGVTAEETCARGILSNAFLQFQYR